jgi:hypothetical protein
VRVRAGHRRGLPVRREPAVPDAAQALGRDTIRRDTEARGGRRRRWRPIRRRRRRWPVPRTRSPLLQHDGDGQGTHPEGATSHGEQHTGEQHATSNHALHSIRREHAWPGPVPGSKPSSWSDSRTSRNSSRPEGAPMAGSRPARRIRETGTLHGVAPTLGSVTWSVGHAGATV